MKGLKEEEYVWKEENFSQLYPQPPIIFTTSTYFIIKLNYKNEMLSVPLPKGIDKKNIPYLLHKAIFYHLLEMKDENPLYKTAQVIGFTTSNQDIELDYQIWKGEGILKQKVNLGCLYYKKQNGLDKYIVYEEIDEKVFLARSLYDGRFCSIKRYDRSIEQEKGEGYFQKIKQAYAKLKHPFVNELLETFMSKEHVYFVFPYIPVKFFSILLKNEIKLNQGHIYFYFSQIIYGLFYLYQQNVLLGELNSKMIGISEDGHILLDYEIVNQNKQISYFQYVRSLILSLMFDLQNGSSDEDQEVVISQELDDFLMYLQSSRVQWKQVLQMKWIKKMSSQTILSKSMKPPLEFEHEISFSGIKRVKLGQLINYENYGYQNLGYFKSEIRSILRKYDMGISKIQRKKKYKLKKRQEGVNWLTTNNRRVNKADEESLQVIKQMKQTPNCEVIHDIMKKRRKNKI